MDNEFNLLNIVVDVACKFVIFNLEYVDIEFKLLNIDVDVLFELLTDNVELLDNDLNY